MPAPARPSKLIASAHEAVRENTWEATMFKLAVLGPIVTNGLGLARQCLTCYRFKAPDGELPCFGFGADCLGYRPYTRDEGDRPQQAKDGDR